MTTVLSILFYVAVLVAGAILAYYVDKALGTELSQLGAPQNANIAHKVMWMMFGSLVAILARQLF